jgi:hypothetical protein
MIGGDECGAINGMNEWQGKQKYSEETCPTATLSTKDHMTWPGIETRLPLWEVGD